MQSGQPELVNDAEADPRGVQIPGTARQKDERLMVVPLVADGAVEGAMAVWRTGGQPFDDRDLQFLAGLARQAMVALRNARLFNETKEGLEQQTATAEVLKVISESPTNVQPVFDTIAERAARLTRAQYGLVFRFDGERIHVVSSFGVDSRDLTDWLSVFPMPADGPSIAARAIRSGKVINVADLLAESDERLSAVMKDSSARLAFAVP